MKKLYKRSCLAICIMCFTLLWGLQTVASEYDPEGLADAIDPEVLGEELFFEEEDSPYILSNGGLLDETPEIYASDATTNAIKTKIKNALIAKETTIDLSAYSNEVTPQEVFKIYRQTLNENPDLFYVNSYISASYGYGMLYLRPQYESYTSEDIEKFYSVVDGILDRIPASYSDIDKLLYLHDYLVTHCEYDMTYQRHNAYNALVEGSSVCQGYSEAYRYLCTRAGLEAKVVSSQKLNHAWNIVVLNGKYYFIDCTWDDPVNITDPGYCGHANFLRSTQGMVATAHEYTDWVSEDGTSVYGLATDDSLYSNSSWKGVRSAILEGEDKEQEYWGTPVISGVAKSGQTLTAQITGGNISGPYTYQWKRNEIAVPNATNQTYKLTNNDIGKTITCEIRKDGKSDVLIAKLNEKVVFDSVPATEVKIIQNSINLKLGSSAQLNYTLKPNNTTDSILWGSDDPSVVAIDQQGKIVAKSAGSTTVWLMTVKNELDETNHKVRKASCTVTVYDPTPATISVTGISLNKSTAQLTTGQTLTLKATVEPSNATDQTVEWTTTDKTVATVSSKGVVTAVGPGEARISAYANGGFGVVTACVVTVSAPAPVIKNVTGITLNKTTAKLTTGQTLTLKATVAPTDATDKTVKWTTNNKSVATVSSKGVVTAVGAGTATITVTAADGSGVKATCKVNVSDPAPATQLVTGITLNTTQTILHVKETLGLQATVAPKNATNKNVNWKSSNTKIVTVDSNGKVTAVAPGTTTVTVTAADGSGISAVCTIKVTKLVTDVFKDIQKSDWWFDAVQYVYDHDIMAGSDIGFEPKAYLTREQFVQVLYNHSGKPGSKGIANKFSDVKNAWYKEAVLWASKNDITSGYEDGRFGVGDKITREQLTVMLYKYAKMKGFDLTTTKGLTDQYKDAKKVDTWAKDAMNWAVTQGIMGGKGTGTDKTKLSLDPLGNATRAECATMIMKLLVKNGIN